MAKQIPIPNNILVPYIDRLKFHAQSYRKEYDEDGGAVDLSPQKLRLCAYQQHIDALETRIKMLEEENQILIDARISTEREENEGGPSAAAA